MEEENIDLEEIETEDIVIDKFQELVIDEQEKKKWDEFILNWKNKLNEKKNNA